MPHPRPWWAGTRLDAWLAAGLIVLSLSSALAMPAGAPYRPVDGWTLALAALGPAALVWRQTAPLVSLTAAGLVVVVNAAIGGTIGFLDWPAWIALFTCFDVGDRRVRTAAVAVTGPALGGLLGLCPRD